MITMFKDEIFSFFNHLKTSPSVQQYLQNCYSNHSLESVDKYSFENTYRFIYYLDHAQTFYKQGDDAPLSIKPILYFYGMVQLLKASILTIRPNYPENTTVLAHGVSARKRKKQNYSFLQDEVKIQQKGLFPYFSRHLFHLQNFPSDKFSMDSLLRRIPELNLQYYYRSKQPIHYEIGRVNQQYISIDKQLLDEWHMTSNRFMEKLNHFQLPINKTENFSNKIIIHLNNPLKPFDYKHPFTYQTNNEAFYISKYRDHLMPFHELLVHYLILYNLSMICRYETEWWGELIHSFSSEDFTFIESFLTITSEKVPLMIGSYLLDQYR